EGQRGSAVPAVLWRPAAGRGRADLRPDQDPAGQAMKSAAAARTLRNVRQVLSRWRSRVAGPRKIRKLGKEETMNLADIGIKGKVFCLSMQRSGTSSVGDFFEQWGLTRMGHQLSRKNQWSRHWYNGNYEAIFG